MKCFVRNNLSDANNIRPTSTTRLVLSRYDMIDGAGFPRKCYVQEPNSDSRVAIETPTIYYDDNGEIFVMLYKGNRYETVDGKLVINNEESK